MPPTENEIPDKKYFRIGEVSALTGLESYVLRYWETEFPHLKPSRSRAGQRLYKKDDIRAILQVKGLLYDRKLTIAGAKQFLKESRKDSRPPMDEDQRLRLEGIRGELRAIRDLLGE